MDRFKQRMYNSPFWKFLHRIRLRIRPPKSSPGFDSDYYESLSLDYTTSEYNCTPYIELSRSSNIQRKKTKYQHYWNNECYEKRISNTESIFTQRSLSEYELLNAPRLTNPALNPFSSALFPDANNLPIRALDGQPLDLNSTQKRPYANLYHFDM